MEPEYWNNTDEDGDRMRRRQAEFLVLGELPLASALGFAVRTKAARSAGCGADGRGWHRPSGSCQTPLPLCREAMITDGGGDLLSDAAEAIVNTVNTEGVMGKGIALQFKQRYPQNYETYRAACKRRQVHLGSMFVVATGALHGPRHIINFPTKGHWREQSRLEHIQAGLRDLVRVINELGINSIALPPLGCGNGGLEWTIVRP
jgi:O-acetyl-ADP-ribose deacetylase (regulator of RNase III)